MAKDDVNNVGAGRAAKGANHFVALLFMERNSLKIDLLFLPIKIDFSCILMLYYNYKEYLARQK